VAAESAAFALSCSWMPNELFKLNQDRRHHIPRQKRQVTNWPPSAPTGHKKKIDNPAAPQ
jgi:hypothetical protein